MGPVANIPDDHVPASKKSQFSPDFSLCNQKGQVTGILTGSLHVALQPFGAPSWLFLPLE